MARSGGYAYGACACSSTESGSTYGLSPARMSSAARRKIAKSYGTARPPSERSEFAHSESSCQRSAVTLAPSGSRIASASTQAATRPIRLQRALATSGTVVPGAAVPWRYAGIARSTRGGGDPVRVRLGRALVGHVAHDHVLGGRVEAARTVVVDAALHSDRRFVAEAGSRLCTSARRRREALRACPEERRVHRDLRRPAEGARDRHRQRAARPGDVLADERLRDRPLAAHLTVARPSGRRHELRTLDVRRYHRRP